MNVASIIAFHLEVVKGKVQARMSELGRNASGKTSASLQVQSSNDKGSLIGSPVLLSIESGRGPGAIPKNFVDIIMEWAKSKGISVKSKKGHKANKESAYRSFAGAVAYNIMKKGTKLHRTRQFDDIFSSVFEEELNKMSEELAINLLEQVSSINDKIQ